MSESSHTDKRETFPTDTEISLDASEERQTSRKLQKWSDVEKSLLINEVGMYASLDDQNSTPNNWTPQAMFEHHEKKYNFKSTYDELEYTTPLPVSSDDQLLKASRMEHEIIREGQHDEEDYDRSEEDLFSKVLRPGNKYNCYRGQKHNRIVKKEFERKTDKREIHPEAAGLPEWRQTAFTKLNSNSDDSDVTVRVSANTKPEEKPAFVQDEVPVLSDEISELPCDTETSLNQTEMDANTPITERTPSARNRSSVQKKKEAIDYIETHSREEIKQNFISFSHDLTPRICTIAKSNQGNANTNTDLNSNSCTNFEILYSKPSPNSENLKSHVSTTIEATENWDLETADITMSGNTSEHSSIHSQLTPTHSHTQSHDSQDSGVLDSEYPPSTESDNNELSKQKQKQQQQQQGSSTLNPQAEEFRFDMSKLSDVILQDPAYLRMLRKSGSQKYPKQPNLSMRGRGNSLVPSQPRGERPSTGGGMGGFNKKPDIPSPGSVAKGRGGNESIVGPTGYSTQKRGSRKGGRFRSVKHQGYKPNFEMEQQLYALPGSQFQVLTNPNGMFYQAGPMQHLPQTGKPGQIPQPIQMATHHTTQRPSVQSIQAMQNQQLPMQQVAYPGFPMPSQMPEDQQVPPQGTQILIGPDGIPMTYIPQSQTEFQPYPQQPPHGYTQHETPQQYIIPQFLPANSGHPQYGYMPVETQPNQVLYSQYPHQGIIQLQNNSKSNMY